MRILEIIIVIILSLTLIIGNILLYIMQYLKYKERYNKEDKKC